MIVYRVIWQDHADRHEDHETQEAADAHQAELARAGKQSTSYEIEGVEESA